MLLYTILVTGPVYGTENSMSAFLFCKKLMKVNTLRIDSIFFYGHGVLNANKMVCSIDKNINLVKKWSKLSKKFNINLNICSNSAQERGIISNVMAKEIKLLHGNVNNNFKITGLGHFVNSILKTDRLLQF